MYEAVWYQLVHTLCEGRQKVRCYLEIVITSELQKGQKGQKGKKGQRVKS